MTDADLIDTIGRASLFASLKPKHPDLTLHAINKWAERDSIPWRFRKDVKRVAAQNRKPVPKAFLEGGGKAAA